MSLAITSAAQHYSDKCVLVTGATGFIGRHLVRALASAGARLCLMAREVPAEFQHHCTFAGDLRDRAFVASLIDKCKPEVVFHLAASRARTLTPAAFAETIGVNLVGTLELLDSLTRSSVLERVVLVGTAEEYGCSRVPFREDDRESPVSAYSLSKLGATHLAQMMAHTSGIPAVVLRPSVAYGPGQQDDMFVPALIRTLLRAERFPMTAGQQSRDFVFIGDLVQALLMAGNASEIDGEVINIGSGEETRIARLVDLIEDLTGTHGHVLKGALEYRPGEAMHYQLDITKAERMLGWKPQITLEEGLTRTVQWYRERTI